MCDWDEDNGSFGGGGGGGSSGGGFSSAKTFGGRGRGFKPVQEDRKPGGGFNRDNDRNDRGGFSRDNDRGDRGGFNRDNDRGDRGGFRRNNDENGERSWKSRDNDDGDRGGYRRRDGDDGDRPPRRNRNNSENGDGDNDGDIKQPPKSTYIPPDPTEDEEELFNSGSKSGINFDKYDSIEVKVSGEGDLPKAIRSFEDAKLREFVKDVILNKYQFTKPTPIQKHAIPLLMAGRDMMACAQTGSGKTAAFLIPIVNKLLGEGCEQIGDSTHVEPQAIIVAPTRELVMQIHDEARKFSRGSNLKPCVAYGGTAVFHQAQMIMRGCNILVATPGRLMDFIGKGRITLNSVKFVVLDEADRMLDMGFRPDMEKLFENENMPSSDQRQTMMFSATFPDEVQRLAGSFLNNYVFVAVGVIGGACDDVEQKFYQVDKFKKREKLIELLKEHGSSRTLVFVEQKRTADIIATFLSEKNFPTTSIHGDREQRQREEALADFKRGKMDILVATAVAARGLDIKNVKHVINFDLPKSRDEYVHRIGRTGRVGNRGLASNLYNENDDSALAPDLVKILQQARQEVPDFLVNAGGSSSYSSSRFGAQDIRNENGNSNQDTAECDEW